MKVNKYLCCIVLLLVSFGLFASYRPYVEVKVTSLSDSANLGAYYSNRQESLFDETHRTTMMPLHEGENTRRIYVPLTGSLNALRIDFGNNADGLILQSITLKQSYFRKVELRGEDILKFFPNVNQIYDVGYTDAGELQLLDTAEQSWIYGDNLLAATKGNAVTDLTSVLYCAGILLLLALMGVLYRYKIKKRSLACDHTLSSGKLACGLQLVWGCVFAFGLALFLDQVILVVGAKIAFLLPFDLLKMTFRPMLQFAWHRVYFWGIWLLLILAIYFLGKEKSQKYRYVLAVGLLALLVLGKFTTSSVGAFDSMLHGNTAEFTSNVLFGMPQGIRADEWAIEKPYYFAQAMNGLPYFNQNLALNGYDMVVSAFAPVLHPMILAKPSLWGFLFLPVEYAFSFYWFSRLIALFMGAYELMRVLNPKFKYAQYSALALVFSPAIQWLLSQWLIDIIIAGMFFVVLWKQFLVSNTLVQKIFAIVGCCFFANMYIYVMYPAAQIPFAYIFLAIFIFITWDNRDKVCSKINFVGIGVMVVSLGAMAALFLANSYDALEVMMNTVYPGSSRVWSSMPWDYELLQLTNPYLSWLKPSSYLNNSEASQFMYAIPVILIAGCMLIRRRHDMDRQIRKVMIALALLCVPAVIMLVSQYLPTENPITKLLFLEMSYPRRISYATGFVFFWIQQVILSIFVQDDFEVMPKSKSFGIVCAVGFFILTLSMQSEYIISYFNLQYLTGFVILFFTVILICLASFFFLRGGKHTKIFLYFYTAVVVFSTILVNPITTGLDSIYEKSLMRAVRDIDASSPGAWITSGNAGIGNLVTAQGVTRRSGYYYYPDVDMMHIIDPEGAYENLWNSFTAVDMRLTTGDNYIESPDANVAIIAHINLDTAKALGIQYILCQDSVELPAEYLENQIIVPRYQDNVDFWSIYEIQWENATK